MKLIYKMMIGIALISISSNIVTAQGTWEIKSPMPTARKEIRHSTVYFDSKIYVIGGIDTTGSISTLVEVYNIVNDSWSTVANLPQAVWRAAAAEYNGKIYLFGGYLTTSSFPFTPSDKVYEYDPLLNVWNEKADMLSVRGSASAVTVEDKIYLLGGASSIALNSVHMYDPANDIWTVVQPMPTSRSGLTASVIQDKIYAAGGYFLSGGVVPLDVLESYDTQTNSWSILSPLPIARLGVGSSVIDDKMYIFGGLPSDVVSKALEYDPVTDLWQELAEMPTPVSFMGVAGDGNYIFVVGGGPENLNRFDAVALNRKFTPTGATGISSSESNYPNNIILSQNYPNPFNPSTKIVFSTSIEANVVLKVYNMLGNEIETLVSENKLPGKYELVFNAEDLASGIYVYRLEVGNFTLSRKMILLK